MKVGFVGAGNMARAIASGLVAKGLCQPEDLLCIGAGGRGAALMAQQSGAGIAESRSQLLAACDIAVLAFKPQHLETITPAEAAAARGKQIVSVLAGRSLASLRSAFPDAANWVRVMPNTPAQIGQGVSTFCFGKDPTPQQRSALESILGALGGAYEIAEEQMHIATVVNGCGPAFYFRIAQLVAQSAAQRGLDEPTALRLAAETAIGSFALLLSSGKEPQTLIDEVVSPNGVTHALLENLRSSPFAEAIDNATEAAVARSIELSQPTRSK